MKLKKVLALGLMFVMTTGLVACGSEKPVADDAVDQENVSAEDSSEAEDTGKTSDVTITFATNVVGTKAEALKEACKAFEEESGYTVDFQAPGDSYEELMKTKMSANELPDVFTTHGWSVARYSDYLMTVNDFEWAADIDDQIKSVITDAGGNMYVLPVDIDIAGVIYNADVLDAAGVNPDDIKTWDDFTAACEKIKATGVTPVHIGGKDSWPIGQCFEWIAPSYYITDDSNSKADDLKTGTFDAETWKEIGGLLDTWVKAGYVNEDALTADYNADVQSFAEGNAAFGFYGNYFAVDAKGVNPDAKIGMIPIPSASEGDEGSLAAGEDIAVGVWKDSSVKEEAIELLNYLAQPEVLKGIAETAGCKAGLKSVTADIGEIGTYLNKCADVEAFPYFDREYLPSGMWDIMCSTGADILLQKDGAVDKAAAIMEQNYNDKFVP